MTLDPLMSASPAIQIHVYAAVAAFVVGAVVLFRRKGGPIHKALGRVWVVLMLVVIVSSFFIHTIRLWGLWSPIHLLSIGTTVSLALGIAAIWKRQVVRHQRIMQLTYLGALVIAGGFTFMPGRIMHEVLFKDSSPMELLMLALGAVLVLASTVGWRRRSNRARPTLSGQAPEARASMR